MVDLVFDVLPESCFNRHLTSVVNESLQSYCTSDGTKAYRGQKQAVDLGTDFRADTPRVSKPWFLFVTERWSRHKGGSLHSLSLRS